MKVSAPCSGPHSKSISGQCTATLGRPGRAPSTISSMLGWVAAVSATESPSQPRPPFIHRMWTTGSAGPAVGASEVVSAVVIDDHLPAAAAAAFEACAPPAGWCGAGSLVGVLPVIGDFGGCAHTLV